MSALGERFRAAREARGLSLSDVAEQIRIRSVYLAAIEDEKWSAIGAPVYVRGFLRTYARFLNLDTDEIVAAFNASSGTAPAPSAADREQATPVHYAADANVRSRNLSPLIWILSLVAVGLIALIFYNEFTGGRPAVPAPAASTEVASAPSGPASPSPAASASPSPTESASPSPEASPDASMSPGASASPLVAGAQSVELTFTAPSWVRVTVDGSVSMEGTFPAGTARLFHGKTAVLRIGNAGGVEVTVDGKSLGTLGKTGDVVERTFTL